jgi:hypothetical protein
MKLLKRMWQILKAAKTIIIVVLLLMSLGFNVAQLTGGLLADVASAAFHTVTGKKSFAAKNAHLFADVNKKLDTEKKANRKLRKQLAKPNTRIVTYKGKKIALSEAVETTSTRMSRRAKKTAAREVASMGGEALPWIGAAVIVSATALEIKDLCDTLKDMNDLKKAFDPKSKSNAEETVVCPMRVPSKDELKASIKNSPQASWNAAKGALFFAQGKTSTIDDLREFQLPEINWSNYLEKPKSAFDGLKSNTHGLLDWWNTDTSTSKE